MQELIEAELTATIGDDVVGILTNTASVIQLVGALRVKINDEMTAAERR